MVRQTVQLLHPGDDIFELFAKHKDHKPGRQHYQENRRQGAMPITVYGRTPGEAVHFAKRDPDNTVAIKNLDSKG